MGQEKHGLAIVLDTVSEEPEQYAVLTKSFGEFIGMKDCAYIDRNNCPFADQLLDLGIAESTPMERQSGFCSYPLWHFREEFLREIGPENYAAYAEGYGQMSCEQDEESFSDDEDEGMGGLS